MDEALNDIDLDDDQLSVATSAASVRQVVIAGPGAGKTHVVSRLVENLIVDEGIDPVQGLLVLSFSNAAVMAASSGASGGGYGAASKGSSKGSPSGASSNGSKSVREGFLDIAGMIAQMCGCPNLRRRTKRALGCERRPQTLWGRRCERCLDFRSLVRG